MRDDELIEQLREGLQRQHEHPGELWEALIRDGIIDAKGNVLVRMPEPPSVTQPVKEQPTRKRTPPSDSNGEPR